MKLNKPIYVGVSILELSRIRMYQFYHGVMKKRYDDKNKLLYTDACSFIFHIGTTNIYKYFDDLKEHMDFSGHDKPHPCYNSTSNKLVR